MNYKAIYTYMLLYTGDMNIEIYTVMSLLEVPSLIEAPPSDYAHCHRIVAPPQNRSAGRL